MRRRGAKAGALALALLVLGSAAIAGAAAVIQQGNLRITLLAQISPYRLPRIGTAPIAVFIAGHVGTVDGSVPPQLEKMTIKVNRHGRLDSTGLPVCSLPQIQPGSTSRALADCPGSLIGAGRFWASIVLPDQRPYPTRGRLLIFNGREGGKPVIYAHIYTTNPFSTSFVITFAIHHIAHGTYGTELSASLPQALGTWGFVDRIKLTLRRKYTYRGQQRSYFNAGCPAAKGTRGAAFPLAQANFSFAGGKQVQLTETKSCGVKE
ncbi:MAG TPA: hypothetical protein VNY83_07225 [Solirubrobacterales bacterium]|jgi:hypothetical protein|nr:hypothetical protein [Solirubrobacterales bacterium]